MIIRLFYNILCSVPGFILALFCSLLITGCASDRTTHRHLVKQYGLSSLEKTQPTDPNVIYHFLLSDFAYAKENHQLSLDSIVSISDKISKTDLLEDNLQLAKEINDAEALTNLASRLQQINPTNRSALLALIDAGYLNDPSVIPMSLYTFIDTIDPLNINEFTQINNIVTEKGNEYVNTIIHSLTNRPKNPNQHLFIASLYADQLNLQKHIEWLDKTIAISPNWEFPLSLKLQHLVRTQPDEWRNFAKQTLKDNPTHNAFRMLYVSHLTASGSIDIAQSQLLELLAMSPNHEPALYLLASILYEKEEYQTAKKYLLHLQKLSPHDERILFLLSDIELEQEHFDMAIIYLNKVYSQQNYFEAQINIAKIKTRSENLESGINYLTQIDSRSNDQQIRLILEKETLYRDHNQLLNALNVITNAMERFPSQPELLYSRGFIYIELEDIKKHEQDMRALLKIDPEHANAYNMLGYSLTEYTDRYQEALALINKANELSPNQGYIVDSLGWVTFKLKQPEKALNLLHKAFMLQQDAEIATHIGEVYWSLGQFNQAFGFWQQAQDLDSDNQYLKQTLKRLTPDLYQLPPVEEPLPVTLRAPVKLLLK